MNNRKSQCGFTLIELLISIALFAMVAVAAALLIQGVSENQKFQEKRHLALSELDFALKIIRQDLEQAVNRPSHFVSNGQIPLVALVGYSSSDEHQGELIRFTRGARRVVPGINASRVQVIRYGLQDGALVRYSYSQPEPIGEALATKRVLIDGIEEVNLKYFNGSWLTAWGNESTSKTLPTAVKIELKHTIWGTFEQVMLLTGQVSSET